MIFLSGSIYLLTEIAVFLVIAATAFCASRFSNLEFSPLGFGMLIAILLMTTIEIPLFADGKNRLYTRIDRKLSFVGVIGTGICIGFVCLATTLLFPRQAIQNPALVLYLNEPSVEFASNQWRFVVPSVQVVLSAVVNLAFQICLSSMGCRRGKGSAEEQKEHQEKAKTASGSENAMTDLKKEDEAVKGDAAH